MSDTASQHHSPPLADIDDDAEFDGTDGLENIDVSAFLNVPSATQGAGEDGDDGTGKNDSQTPFLLSAPASQNKRTSPIPGRPTTGGDVSPLEDDGGVRRGTKRTYEEVSYGVEEDELQPEEDEPFDPTAEVVPFDAVKDPNEHWINLQKSIKKTLHDVATKMITDVFELLHGVSHDLHAANSSTRAALVDGLSTVKKEEERHVAYVKRFKAYSDHMSLGKDCLNSPPQAPARGAFRANPSEMRPNMQRRGGYDNVQGDANAYPTPHGHPNDRVERVPTRTNFYVPRESDNHAHTDAHARSHANTPIQHTHSPVARTGNRHDHGRPDHGATDMPPAHGTSSNRPGATTFNARKIAGPLARGFGNAAGANAFGGVRPAPPAKITEMPQE